MKTEENPFNKKSSLLAQWKSRKGKEKSQPSITRLPERTPAPLSFGQRRLWFLQQMYPENPFYHFADAYRFKGKFEPTLFFQSLEVVAQQHDILRTTFEVKDNAAFQKINAEARIETALVDLRHFPKKEREAEAKRLATINVQKSFDLENGPLARFTIFQLEEEEFLILACLHHIITDQWSMKLLWEELAGVYKQLVSSNLESPKLLPLQYADFAYWQTQKETDVASLAYWKKKLSGNLPILQLPTDRSRPVAPSYKGAFHRQIISEGLTLQLKELAKGMGTTMFVLFLAAYKIFLYRYTSQEDVLVGTPVANRDQVAFEKIIGFFLETVVLRSDFSKTPTCSDLIQQVKTTTLEAFSHKNIPFEILVKDLKPQRQGGISPLFQTMFVYHASAAPPSFGEGIEVMLFPFEIQSAKFDLTLHVSENENQLTTVFEYATDLFDQPTIERMQGHFHALLEGLVQNPEQDVSVIDILPKTEKDKILFEWNSTKTGLPNIPYIHHWIEEQAAKHPNRTAVVFENEKLTYQQLNEQATSIAQHLIKSGVQPNTFVGLYIERSVEMAVGILAILKAGGAYLPLDPKYPTERIKFMVEDAGVSVILTVDGFVEGIDNEAVKIVGMYDLPPTRSDDFKKPNLKKEDAAYIIYTSGSTGKPKGVVVSHKNLIHSTYARFQYYPEMPKAFLLMSSFAFDSSVAGIFGTLCSGGTLVIPRYRIEQDVEEMADLIEKHLVSDTLLLPSLYSMILQNVPLQKLRSLETVIVAGEACTGSLCHLHFSKFPKNVGLYNEYGPTEASVWCTAHQLTTKDSNAQIPIGKPIPNAQNYILDKNLEPVPVGVTGDLYIGGEGITNGYLHRPELTAERFVKSPFHESGDLYKTGDLASYRPDGTIDFLGRADHQVKIRGFRIELEGIREVIKQQDGVEEAYVVIQKEKHTSGFNEMEEEEIMAETLANLDEMEAERLLQSVESLSDEMVGLMLKEMTG